MFPSCGYFSSFPCPFFVNGLCERPYCHFRHSKHDVEKAKEDAPCSSTDDTTYSTSTSTSRCSSPVDSALSSANSKPEPAPLVAEDVYFTSASEEKMLPPPPTLSQEQEPDAFSIPSFTDNSSKYQVPIAEEPEQYVTASPEKTRAATGSPILPTYLPTPKTPSLPAPEPVKDDFGVPVYQPTPKRELKRRHGDHVKVKGTNIEYDPECNYSCGGLTNSSHEPSEQTNDLSYQPTRKKARGSTGLLNKRNARLSCDSLMASSPDLISESGDDMPEAEFSEEEDDEEETVGKTKDATASLEEGSEKFENIGDDDISSDDEFVDVPEVPPRKTNKKNEMNALIMPKASSSSSEKATKDSSRTKLDSVTTNHKQQKQTSKSSSSKSSGSKQPLVSSPEEPVIQKTDRSSSHNKSTSSSASGKIVKHDSSKPSSSSIKSSSSSKKSSKESSNKLLSTKLSSKQKQEHNSKMKEHNFESTKSCDLSEKRSKSNNSSSSSNKDSSLSRKSSLSDTKSSSSKHIVSVSKNDALKRSSMDSKTTDARQLSLISKDNSRSNSADRQSSGSSKSNVSRKHSNSESKNSSRKHSIQDLKSDKLSQVDSLSASAGSGSRHSSSDCKSTKTSERRSHSKTSESSRKSSSIKNTSNEKSSSHSVVSKKGDFEKVSKEQKVCEKRSSSSPSTSKYTESQEKAQKPTSSSHNKKSSSKKSNSNSKDSTRKALEIERLNSNLFGDDSDDDNDDISVSRTNCDGSGESSFDEPSTSKVAEEDMDIDYSSYIHDSDVEDEDTFDECLRIFKEQPPKKMTKQEKKLEKDLKADDSSRYGAPAEVPGKKRTAHKLAEQVRKPELLKKERPRKILSPSEVMHNRIMEMKRRALEKAANQVLQEQEVSSTSGSASRSRPEQGGEKKRVAHTPKPVATPKSFSVKSDGKGILNKAGSEPEKRVAHTPNVVNLKRPLIPASFGSKVPSNIRQRYLNLIIDECLKFCPNQEQAYKKGLEEETSVYDRASNKNIYLRVAVNTITRLRNEAKEAMPGSSKSQQKRSSLTQSHEATIGGSRAAKTSFTLHRSNSSGKKEEVPLTAMELYQKLLKYTLSEEQLVENGYPMPSPDTPGKAVVSGSRYQATDTLLKANERNCARCGTRFIVNENGEYTNSEDCVYHWSRAYPRKKSGFIQHIYNCCGSDTSSKGCQIATNHVHERNKKDSLTGFMRTMPRSPPRDGNFGIFALDCEMVYTLGGLELARVTVIDVEGETEFEALVQPFHSIVDFNTRFSGLKAADLKDVKTTLTDVQAVLLSLFSDKTILIGHSLESDLFALKLIHKTVVDTSVVFPHRLGPPYKRALKNLMLETFQKIIQCDDGGHDSKEDAMACLQLMKWRLKEDSKREQRYS